MNTFIKWKDRFKTKLDNFRNAWMTKNYQLQGAEIGTQTTFEKGAEISPGPFFKGPLNFSCSKKCKFSQGVLMHLYNGKLTIGESVFIGPYSIIYSHGGVEIGDFSLIAMNCTILSSSHDISDISALVLSLPDILKPTKIGRNVWIGTGATILGGVTIGDGAVIGAGSIVTKDVPARSVVAGNPATLIRNRGEKDSH